MNIKDEIVGITGGRIKNYLALLDEEVYEKTQEIRIRVGEKIQFKASDKKIQKVLNTFFIPEEKDLSQTMEMISGYSLYAYNEEIRKGFITVKGGHRIGVCGKVIFKENQVIDIRHITSINIRLAHEIAGCGEGLFKYIYENKNVLATMIIAPPNCGKTTLLRDFIRLIAKEGIEVSVIDERSEIFSKKTGDRQNIDVLEGCPKAIAMKMALRSMAPKVIAVDEIGTEEDLKSIWEMTCCGVKVICTSHGEDVADILNRVETKDLVKKGLFDRYLFLENKNGQIGYIKKVLDKNLKILWQGDG